MQHNHIFYSITMPSWCYTHSTHGLCFQAVKPGGVVTPVALDIEEVIVPMAMVLAKEVEIKGVFSYYGKEYGILALILQRDSSSYLHLIFMLIIILLYVLSSYPSAIALVASGQVKPSPVISHHFGMKDTEKAINFFVGNQDKALKCMIDLDSN